MKIGYDKTGITFITRHDDESKILKKLYDLLPYEYKTQRHRDINHNETDDAVSLKQIGDITTLFIAAFDYQNVIK